MIKQQRSIHATILNSSSSLYRAAFTAAILAISTSAAHALPSDGAVEAGDVNIQQPTDNSMVIDQTSDRAIINWNSFDILNGQSVRFNQNSSSSITLNRVTGGGGASQILGSLSANGTVVLVNPNGVFFGAGSKVDVAGMIATTADIRSSDFLAGNMNFSKAGNPNASIINKGMITASDGGLVALVAPGVRNDGVIQANLGTVTLGSAQTFTVDMYGDSLYSFALGDKTTATPLDENGKPMDSAVENTGTITAQAGRILLTANAARDVVSHAVNNTGVLEASSAYMDGGTVVLSGGEEGNVRVAGTVNASGKKSGSKGGKVTVTGETITLAGAQIDASGAAAGGTVLIGGDYQGQGSLQHAQTTDVDAASSINVSALENGNGGTAVIWSDVKTNFLGSITGTGGVLGGNGGTAEVSSKGELNYNGLVDMHADLGAAGNLLLDPLNIYIDALAAAAIEFVLNHNTNVTVSTPNFGPQAGNITVGSTIDWTGSGSLTLNADNNIIVNKDITSTWATSFGNRGAVTLNAGGDIILNGATISTAAGDVTFVGNNVSLLGGLVNTGSGDIWINNSGIFYSSLAGALNASALSDGSVSLRQNVGGSIQNAVDAVGTTGTPGGLLILGAGKWVENVTITHDHFTLMGQGSSTIIASAAEPSQDSVIFVKDADGVTISYLKVDGQGYNGIHAKGASNLTVANTTVVDADSAIRLDNTSTAFLFGNIVRSSVTGMLVRASNAVDIYGNDIVARGDGIRVRNSNDVDISKNTIKAGGNGIKVSDSQDLTVSENSIRNTGLDGIFLNRVDDALVSGNTILGAGRNGINAHDVSDSVIAGNAITGSARNGINVETGTNVSIARNQVDNSGEHGITVTDAFGVRVLDNRVRKTGLDGIHLDGVVLAQVDGNKVRNAGQDGIYANDLTGALIMNNVIKGSARNGLTLNDGKLVVVADNRFVRSGANGVQVTNSADVAVLGNTIRRAGNDGIQVDGVDDILVRGNDITRVERDGIYAANLSGDVRITYNNVDDAGRNGINLIQSNGAWVAYNRVTNAASNGFRVGNSDDVSLQGNYSANNGRGYLIEKGSDNAVLTDNVAYQNDKQGFLVRNSLGVSLLDNVAQDNGWAGIRLTNSDDALLRYNTVEGNARGIRITDSDNAVIRNNLVRNNDETGIWVQNSDNATVRGNWVTDNATGVLVDGSDNALITNNTIRRNGTGVSINDAANVTVDGNRFRRNGTGLAASTSSNVTVSNNRFRGDTVGISFTDVTDSSIINNDLDALIAGGPGDGGGEEAFAVLPGSTTGIIINGGSNVLVNGNSVSNYTTGLSASTVTGLSLNGNRFINNGTGVLLTNVDGATLSGDIFTGNNLGIDLNGSSDTQLTGLTITTPEGGTGLRIANGSANTLVSSVSFNGGEIAVLLDGEGSSMQFGDDASSFTGMNYYFVLQNAAMDTDVLDASQQTFDGVRAVDFTVEQLADAEAKTIDVEDGAGVGDVFYKSFLSPDGALDEFQRRRAANARRTLFSYAGRTVSNNVEDQPTTFQTASINLSLLNAAQPTNAAGIANLFANLAPAAGGKNAQALAKLSPSAGGSNAAQLAQLAPSAGSASLSCGNSFLGEGFASTTIAGSCTAQ